MSKQSDFNQMINVIGERWNLCIINVLYDGAKRFSTIEKLLTINSVTLTARLKKLEALGFLQRIEHSEDKQSVLYSLTKKGEAMQPVLREIKICMNKVSK